MSYTQSIAMDCEMVGGPGGRNMAARVSLVNENGQVILDEYIKPSYPIVDYRTSNSGITVGNLVCAQSLAAIKPRVAQAISGRILVGHSLDNDLEALELNHPENKRRDLALHERFRQMNRGQPASLKSLASSLLGKSIQDGQHSSVEDAKTSMEIYRKHWN